MPKLLIRLFAGVVIPCLLGDSIQAVANAATVYPHNPARIVAEHVLFEREAISGSLIDVLYEILNRTRPKVKAFAMLGRIRPETSTTLVTSPAERAHLLAFVSRLLDHPLSELSPSQWDTLQRGLSALGFKPLYPTKKTLAVEAPTYPSDESLWNLHQGDEIYLQYEVSQRPVYRAADIKYRMSKAEKPGRKTWLEGSKVTVLEPPGAQNGGRLFVRYPDGRAGLFKTNRIVRIYPLGRDEKVARWTTHLFQIGNKVAVFLDPGIQEGVVIGIAKRPGPEGRFMTVQLSADQGEAEIQHVRFVDDYENATTERQREDSKNKLALVFQRLQEILASSWANNDLLKLREQIDDEVESLLDSVIRKGGLYSRQNFDAARLAEIVHKRIGLSFVSKPVQQGPDDNSYETEIDLPPWSAHLTREGRLNLIILCSTLFVDAFMLLAGRSKQLVDSDPPTVQLESIESAFTLNNLYQRTVRPNASLRERLFLARDISRLRGRANLDAELTTFIQGLSNLKGVDSDPFRSINKENFKGFDDEEIELIERALLGDYFRSQDDRFEESAPSNFVLHPLEALQDSCIFQTFQTILATRFHTEFLARYWRLGGTALLLTAMGMMLTPEEMAAAITNFLYVRRDRHPLDVAKEFWKIFGPSQSDDTFLRPPELRAIETPYFERREELQSVPMLNDLLSGVKKIVDLGVGRNDRGKAILADESVDLVIFKWSLHHMTPQEQQTQIREAARILKPGHQLVIIENLIGEKSEIEADWLAETQNPETWPEGEWTTMHREATLAHQNLSPDQQKLQSLLNDYYGHWLYRKHTEMPLPFGYGDAAHWQALSASAGLTEVRDLRRAFGLAPIIHNGTVSVRYVFVKPNSEKMSGEIVLKDNPNTRILTSGRST